MFFEHISTEVILFFILYGVTGVVPFIAALYLLLRRGNAFAPDVTPPLRLRRWAAAFFVVSALGHVWWWLLYVHSGGYHSMYDGSFSVSYLVVVLLDCVTLLTTIAGTLLAMLQDRKRPVWPVPVAMIPFVVMGGVLMVYPSNLLLRIAIAYVLLLYLFFTVYMAFAVRQYGRWLRDNYVDLERKEVWLSQLVTFVCMLLFFFYALVGGDLVLIFFLHFTELVLFGLLLWRVETLPQLEVVSMEQAYSAAPTEAYQVAGLPVDMEGTREPGVPAQAEQPTLNPSNFNLSSVGQLLAERCVATHLYLQHDLTLLQLAKTLNTNRTYLGQYFSSQGTTYNAYINDLRIRHFVSRYRDTVRNNQFVTAQQLASESGYRSYSTFSLAFKQRMGQSVTSWMREAGSEIPISS